MAIPIYSWVEVIGPSIGDYTHDMGRRGLLNEITGEGNYFFGEGKTILLSGRASLKPACSFISRCERMCSA